MHTVELVTDKPYFLIDGVPIQRGSVRIEIVEFEQGKKVDKVRVFYPNEFTKPLIDGKATDVIYVQDGAMGVACANISDFLEMAKMVFFLDESNAGITPTLELDQSITIGQGTSVTVDSDKNYFFQITNAATNENYKYDMGEISIGFNSNIDFVYIDGDQTVTYNIKVYSLPKI